MREAAFIKQHATKWKRFEELLSHKSTTSPDEHAELFIQLTDDLSYAKTFYPKSEVTQYLNKLTAKVHQSIYKNKREDSNRILSFWRYELPYLFYKSHKQLLYAFIFFSLSIFIGALSAANDDTFVRLILGDEYINMTLENIEKGDPMAVYKQRAEVDMFLGITLNNIRVSFMAFAMGIFLSFGTAYILFTNGIMVGAFQYFFYTKGLFLTSFLTIWIHGTLEISAIVIAGCAGFVMGNSILFPGTYSRLNALKMGAKQGLKIIIGLVPIFIVAGFLEGFVTRQTDLPILIKCLIILISWSFIIGYFVIYPIYLNRFRVKLTP
jgi:uncharacterized membrane protein SpoIIM required for sporulation